MKRLLLILTVLCSALLVLGGSAQAYWLNDNTLVIEGHNDGAATSFGATDVIGAQFNIHGIDLGVSNGFLNFSLYSDFSGNTTVAGVNIRGADLFLDLDCDGEYEYGVVVSDREGLTPGAILALNTPGTVPTLAGSDEINTSFDYFETANSTNGQTRYGEFYSYTNDQNFVHVPVHLTSDAGESSGYTATLGNPIPEATGGSPAYLWEIAVPDALLAANTTAVGVFWAGSTCGNDIIEGKEPIVPEPATMLLLGAGLVGLAGFGRKKFFKE